MLSAKDVATMLRFERDLGADSAAFMVLRKLNPEHLKLLEAVASKTGKGKSIVQCVQSIRLTFEFHSI
jgi:hypothetical protein